jgi:hypothetical protein
MDTTFSNELFGDNEMSEEIFNFSTISPAELDHGSTGPQMRANLAEQMAIDPLDIPLSYWMKLNPEAESFEMRQDVFSAPADQTSSLLLKISEHLKKIEASVEMGNERVGRLEQDITTALPKLLAIPQEFRDAIEALKLNLKAFVQGVLQQLLGGK